MPETINPALDASLATARARTWAEVLHYELDKIPADHPTLASEGARQILAAAAKVASEHEVAAQRATRARVALDATLAKVDSLFTILREHGFRSFRGYEISTRLFAYAREAKVFISDGARHNILADIQIGEDCTLTFRGPNDPASVASPLDADALVMPAIKTALKLGLVAPYESVDGSAGSEAAKTSLAEKLPPEVLAALKPAFKRTEKRIRNIESVGRQCKPFSQTVLPALEPFLQRLRSLRLVRAGLYPLVISTVGVHTEKHPCGIGDWSEPAIPAHLRFEFNGDAFSLYPNLVTGTIDLIRYQPYHRPRKDEKNRCELLARMEVDDYEAMQVAILEQLCALGAKATPESANASL